MIRVPVRDDDDIDLQVGGIGQGTMPRQRSQAPPEERIRQDAHPVDLDEGGRVPEEADLDAPVRRARLRRAA